MIVVPVMLASARTGDTTILATIIIDNQGGTRARRNYRCRAYAKGADRDGIVAMVRDRRPIRTAEVIGHRSEAEPVGNLIAKALTALGYG